MLKSIQELPSSELFEKRVILREDFNVPMSGGVIASDARIWAALPTIKYLLKQNAGVILLSHLGRPTEGERDPNFSLRAVSEHLSTCLDTPVELHTGPIEDVNARPGQVVLLENVRFLPGEKACDETLVSQLANLGDMFVMDAFAVSHRRHASTYGLSQRLPSYSGLLLEREVKELNRVMTAKAEPVVAIIAGSKISTKLTLLNALLEKVDVLIVGGGIANTFLAAQGISVGSSLMETALIPEAQKVLERAKSLGVKMPLPSDVILTETFSPEARVSESDVGAILKNQMIVDFGTRTNRHLAEIIEGAKIVLWNGPVGVFEFPRCGAGTKSIIDALSRGSAYSIVGGGDTISALEHFDAKHIPSYISTGGGAFISYIQTESLFPE